MEGRPVRFELDLDGAQIAAAFGAQMDGFSFTEVTVLELPKSVSTEEFSTWPAVEQEAYWINAAEFAGVDLILAGQVRYNPVARSRHKNGRVTPVLHLLWNLVGIQVALKESLPALFYLNAAFEVSSWRSDDTIYAYEVVVNGELHDAYALGDQATGATIANGQAALTRIVTFESESTMGFTDRARPFDYVTSLIVPSGLLPGSAKKEQKALREQILERVLTHWLHQFNLNKDELFECPDVVPFEVNDVELVQDSEGAWVLLANIRLDVQVIDVMDGYTVWNEDVVVAEGSLVEPSQLDSDGWASHTLRVPLPDLESGRRVRLEIRDGALRQGTRRFSFIAGHTGSQQRKSIRLDLDIPNSVAP